MGNKRMLETTTWILGTGVLYALLTCYVIFITSSNYGAGIMSMTFAYLLPVTVIDQRKELRGIVGCISWWAIALFVAMIYSQMNLILLTLCLLVSLFISFSVLQIHNIGMQKECDLRKNKGMVRVGDSSLIIACYLAAVSLVFAISWYVVADMELFAVALMIQSYASLYYVFYYWKWSICVNEKSVVIVRWSQEQEYSRNDIHVIRKIPFGYYVVLDHSHKVIFTFSMSMEQSSKLWMYLRTTS